MATKTMATQVKLNTTKEEYVLLKGDNGKVYNRKYYERSTGKFKGRFLVYLKNEAYSFKMEHVLGINDYQPVDLRWEFSVVEGTSEEDMELAIESNPVVEEKGFKIVRHVKQPQIKLCIENNIPVYLAGPAGSGKNFTLEQIAKEMNMDFYFTNSVQQEYKITGFIDAGGVYHETEFYKAFVNGGLFFLDEMDASIPEVLVLLNAAIANGYFEFPNGKVTAHEGFRVVAAGNTVGNGADEQYTGRLVLDQATLDRFVIINFDYDKNIELHLAKGNIELVNFVEDLRKQAAEKGIRATFSYRCIMVISKLEGKLALKDIMEIAVVKGLDKDTIRMFHNNGSKYGMALNGVGA